MAIVPGLKFSMTTSAVAATPPRDGSAFGMMQVGREALLVAVEHREEAGARAEQPPRAFAVDRLDLDDLGAHVREDHAARRPMTMCVNSTTRKPARGWTELRAVTMATSGSSGVHPLPRRGHRLRQPGAPQRSVQCLAVEPLRETRAERDQAIEIELRSTRPCCANM